MSQYPQYPPSPSNPPPAGNPPPYPQPYPHYPQTYPVGYGVPPWAQGYGYPPGGSRPGLLSAIGVLSIIIGSLGILGGGLSGLAGFGLYKGAQLTTAMATSSSSQYTAPTQGAAAASGAAPDSGQGAGTSPGQPGAQAPNEPVVGPHGMGEADRATAVDALDELEPLSAEQRRQLAFILMRAGFQVFPSSGPVPAASAGSAGPATRPALTAQAVTAAVRGHGTVPSADPREAEPVFYDTTAGYLEIHDARAIFRPHNSVERQVRTSAPADAPDPSASGESPKTSAAAPAATPGAAPASEDPFAPAPASQPAQADPFANSGSSSPSTPGAASPAGSGASTAAPTGAPATGFTLTPAQVKGVIQKVQAACGNQAINPAQVTALQTALSAPNQQLVTPGTIWSPVSLATFQPDGSLLVRFTGAMLIIDPQGQVTNQYSMMMPKMAWNPMPIAIVIGESVASLALATFLLFSGIFVMKQSPRGRRFHLIYAVTKIPLAVIAIAGLAWLGADLTENFNRANAASGGGGGGPGGFINFTITMAALGVIYPIALLIALNTKTVRDYYRAMSAEA